MKIKFTRLPFFLVITLFFINGSNAQDTLKNNKKTISGYIETNYLRHYLWRGALWGNNDVSQPELHIDYGNFSFATSSNLNIFPKNLSEEFYTKKTVLDEQDIELGYQNHKGKLEYQVLLWGYFYFNQIGTPNTGELYTKLQYPVYRNLKVYTENVADIAAYKGSFYNSTGFIYEKEIGQLAIEAKLFSGAGNKTFNNAYYAHDAAALIFVGSSLNMEYSFKNNLYVAAKAEYNQYSNKAIKEITGLKHTDNISVYFGLEF
jgi:hypothetical protein